MIMELTRKLFIQKIIKHLKCVLVSCACFGYIYLSYLGFISSFFDSTQP